MSKKITRQDLRDAAEKYKNWGKWGPTTRSARSTTRARGHHRGGAARTQRQGDLARAQLRPHRPAGREEQLPGDGPHQSDPHHDPHRHRRLFRRARQARHPRRRRHGDDAAAVRHAMGRARPRLLREQHVERLRLPRGDLGRRAEVRHREDQEQDGRPRRVPRRGARARQGNRSRTATASPARISTTPPRRRASTVKRGDYVIVRTGQMERCLKAGSWDGYPGGDAPGFAFETLEWISAHRARRARERHLGLRGAAEQDRGAASTSPGTGSPSRSWA